MGITVTIFLLYKNSPKKNTFQQQDEKIKFIVQIPTNTPEEDIIYMYNYQTEGIKEHKMEKIDNYKYTISFSQDEIENTNGFYHYRYGRNGWNFIPSEYLEPNTNDYFWTQLGRKISFPEKGHIQEDIVQRWRWFPEGELKNQDISYLITESDFPERINKIEFKSGQVIQDLYIRGFEDFFNSTAKHMKERGYKWAVLAPPWQWLEQNPLPKIGNSLELGISDASPNYPNDEIFLAHIKAFKDEGLKVAISPQDCCISINTKNKNKEWWEEYYSEIERFLVHHAKIAEQGRADAFYYAVSGADTSNQEESWVKELEDKRWPEIFDSIRREFSGEIGQGVWVFNLEGKNDIIPQADYITWGDELDFFYFMADGELSPKENPTDAELKIGAERILDGAKSLHEKYGKPIWVQTSYFSISKSWQGGHFENPGIPGEGEPEEAYSQGLEFSGIDQARTVNAYFEALSERPWIVGYNQFGYWHWEMPRLPDWSVRGKEAEDIWEEWNRIIYS